MKIIDLGGPWRSLTTSTVGYPSNSWAKWASCCNLCCMYLFSAVTLRELALDGIRSWLNRALWRETFTSSSSTSCSFINNTYQNAKHAQSCKQCLNCWEVEGLNPPNCFLNPHNTLSNYVQGGQLYRVSPLCRILSDTTNRIFAFFPEF